MPRGPKGEKRPADAPSAAPMRVFAIGIKVAGDVPFQCPHDADPREHRRPAVRRDQHQDVHCCLPFRGFMLGWRQSRDVVAGVLKRDKVTAARKRDRIVECPFPASCFTRSDARAPK
jgi:hypothetical protein